MCGGEFVYQVSGPLWLLSHYPNSLPQKCPMAWLSAVCSFMHSLIHSAKFDPCPPCWDTHISAGTRLRNGLYLEIIQVGIVHFSGFKKKTQKNPPKLSLKVYFWITSIFPFTGWACQLREPSEYSECSVPSPPRKSPESLFSFLCLWRL